MQAIELQSYTNTSYTHGSERIVVSLPPVDYDELISNPAELSLACDEFFRKRGLGSRTHSYANKNTTKRSPERGLGVAHHVYVDQAPTPTLLTQWLNANSI